jgi:hypothetical protein
MIIRVNDVDIRPTKPILDQYRPNGPWPIHVILNYIFPIDNTCRQYYLTRDDAIKIIHEGKHTLFGSFMVLYHYTDIEDLEDMLQIPRELLYSIQQSIEAAQLETKYSYPG